MRYLLIVLPLLALPALGAQARTAAPAGDPEVTNQDLRPALAPFVSVSTDVVTQTYTVRNGDTLSAIAVVLGRSWMQLAGANKLGNPDLILPGQVLQVPDLGYRPPVSLTSAPEGSSSRLNPPPPPRPSGASPPSSVSMSGVWACIAHYESGSNPAENTGNGYYGEFQFAPSTWQNMMSQMGLGYRSYPYAAAAPASVQLSAAERLQSEAGWDQWPVTSHKCGV